ncbi:hypothetical protein DL96DRAFT_237597 [Flagelloscypha sp. PMI_526]|nr:hypothetical protein DL96DRAFT_237597 [Flagelloscypha sp. PMI_526]
MIMVFTWWSTKYTPSTQLPQEIWLQIITHVPYRTIQSLTKVDRTLRQMLLPTFLEILDLAPIQRRGDCLLPSKGKGDTVDWNAERETLLQGRLHLAQTIPSAVRVIHLVPYHGFVENIYLEEGLLRKDCTPTSRRPRAKSCVRLGDFQDS